MSACTVEDRVRDLAGRARDGDEAALREAYKLTHPELLRGARAWALDPHDAEIAVDAAWRHSVTLLRAGVVRPEKFRLTLFVVLTRHVILVITGPEEPPPIG